MLRRGGLPVKAGARGNDCIKALVAHGTTPGDIRQALERAQAAVPPGETP